MGAGGTGRAAFRHLAPEGFRVRLMEPGEAAALHALGAASGLFGAPAPELPDFVRWLLRHEIFVAQGEDGSLSGFAAARDAVDLYWLAGLAVDPAARGRGIRKALLGAVVTRAGWFFHRAVGLALRDGESADWYRRRRFLEVGDGEGIEALAALGAEAPGFPVGLESEANRDDGRPSLAGIERVLMVRWL